jgi:hypothetical protein
MKRKSNLQKRREDPNSKLWRNKADKLWSKTVFNMYGGKCLICRSDKYLQAHHLIPREMLSHRHVLKNGVLACCSHHKYSYEISAHKAPIAFYKWIMINKPEIWEWVSTQVPTKTNTITFKQAYEILLKQSKQIISQAQ